MPFSPHSGLSKPRQAPTPISLPSDVEEHPRKKPKLGHPSRPPANFWDNLSKKHLGRSILEEHNRRVAEESAWRRDHWPRRPATRRAAPIPHIQDASVYFENSTPGRQAQIKRFSREGGPDLSDIRGFRSMSQSSLGRRKRGSASPAKRSTTGNTTSTKSTGPYDRAFQQHLTDYGILPPRYEYPSGETPPPPDNIEEIRARLTQPRPSLSPSKFTEKDFRNFERADAHAFKEAQVVSSVIPIIEGDVKDRRCVSGQIPFTNLDHLTDGSLVPGNPDRYHGARPEQLDRKVRADLDGLLIPSNQRDLPILPNAFLAVKGPDGSSAVAQRQACYDGALGARAMHRILCYKDSEPAFDNKGRILTTTYHDGQLKMYTIYVKKSDRPDNRPEYVPAPLGAYALTGDADSCRRGINAYRQGLDWAKEQRDEAIKQANLRAGSSTEGDITTHDTSGSCTPLTNDAESSADELAYEESKRKRGRPMSRLAQRRSVTHSSTSTRGKRKTLDRP
ncbi:hypothetical protein JX266_014237 [Neoarthrinium moseri]|nr:hypothetical protein JX266_014237 [Neoarthrinium moseri]